MVFYFITEDIKAKMGFDGFDPYAILGVSYEASQRAARLAAFKLLKKHHPDKGGQDEDYVSMLFVIKVFNFVLIKWF